MALLKKSRSQKTGTLFPLATRFRLAELGKLDAQKSTDNLKTLKELIVANQRMYPNIDRWFDDKVVPGLKSSERIAYVAYEDERPIASAVVKVGEKSKFCHLRVHENFQDMDLGQMFFTQMTLRVRHYAQEIHFTLPESLWCTRSKFFESFGFSCAAKASKQYRIGDTELVCSAPMASVWAAVLDKLPRLLSRFTSEGSPVSNRLLISMKPIFAERILLGSKLIEIRKRFSGKWTGCRAVLYSSRPVSALVGEATVNSVTHGSPAEVWSNFHQHLGCSHKEFQTYVGSAETISAIHLKDIIPYDTPLGLNEMSHLLNQQLRPPQSFCDLAFSDKGWAQAVSFASFIRPKSNCTPGEPNAEKSPSDTVFDAKPTGGSSSKRKPPTPSPAHP
jgi:predicted transcriptional regulator